MSTRLLALLLCILSAAGAIAAVPAPIPVKVVVISLFEPGADTGDTPGEYQYWVEREHLDRVFPFPQGFHDLRMNEQGVLGVLAGVGTARAAASIMALGLDPRFDLSKAYWLVAGIAGADPDDASLGSAVWAEWVVDGDLAYEIDSREIPPGWTTGYVPLNKTKPSSSRVTTISSPCSISTLV
jgi:purine nucleoside permease